MTNFNKNEIVFDAKPESKVELPASSKQKTVFLDSADNKIKTVDFKGTVEELAKSEVNIVSSDAQVTPDGFEYKITIPNPTKKLIELEATLKSLIAANDAATLENIKVLQEQLNQLKSDLSAALSDSEVALSKAVVALEKQLEEVVLTTENASASVGKRIDTLGSDFANIVTNINAVLADKASKKEVASAVAGVASQIPSVVAGSDNVTVTKKGTEYSIAVDVPEVTREVVKEVQKVGGGISKGAVEKMIDEALDGYTPGGGGTVSVVESSGGSILVVPISGGYNIETNPLVVVEKTSGTFEGYPATIAQVSGNELITAVSVQGDMISTYAIESIGTVGILAKADNGMTIDNISGTATLRSTDPDGGGVTLLAKRSIPTNSDTVITLMQSPCDESAYINVVADTVNLNQALLDQPLGVRIQASTYNDVSGALAGSCNTSMNAVQWFDIADNRPKVDTNTLAYLSDITAAVASVTAALDPLVVHTYGDETINGVKTFADDVVVNGDMFINGTQFVVDTEEVSAKDNLIVINAGEVGPGVTKGVAGIRVDRGSADPYDFMFRE